MSTLTKVFVVMLVVSSIAFTTVAVSMSAQTTNWRNTADGLQKKLTVADTTISGLHAAHAAQLATLRDTVKTQLDRIAKLDEQLKTAQGDVAKKDTTLNQTTAELGSVQALNQGLKGLLDVSQTNEQSFRKQRDDLEKEKLDLQTRNIGLNERVSDQTAQIAVLEEQRRQFEQQLDILRRENTTLARQANRLGSGAAMEDPKGTGLAGVTALSPVASTAVRGKVVSIDGNILTLSVGNADGVEKDMEFVIRRNGQYVGDLAIQAVEPNRSAGRITRQALAPQPNDEIIDLSHLASSRG